jgi:phosphatidate cytidylyltransferase
MAHLKRWLTAIVAIPILIYVIGFGPRWGFQVLVCLAAMIALWEYYDIAIPRLPLPVKFTALLLALVLFGTMVQGPFFLTLSTVSLWLIVLAAFRLFAYPAQRDHAVDDVAKTVMGLLYVCLPLALLLFIDKHPRGSLWVFFLLTVIFANDTGAYYAGRLLGKHKLHPSVSPNKTWEGTIGGIALSLIASYLFVLLFPLFKTAWQRIGLTVTIAILGQIGDLTESMLKRNYGRKDTGKILPGHGGVLDRIDGLLFGVPVLYVYLTWSIA